MRRKKRFTLVRIALAMAVIAAILPVTAQAKPTPGRYDLGPGEIPYLSHGQGVDSSNFGLVLGSDDRSLARSTVSPEPQVVIPYMSHGQGVTSAELGFAVSNAADDRPFARTNPETTPVVTDGGRSIEVNPYLATGMGIALLLAMGMGFALWHTRKTRLSPA